MPVDKSSLSAKVLYGEPSQTASDTIDNQDIEKDNQDKSSSSKVQDAQEPHQTPTLDANKNDNTSTPEFEATTNDSANNLSPPDVETSTTQAPDSDASKHATEISNHESQNSTTTQILDSDSANMIGTHDSQKSSTTMVPSSNQDANSVEGTNPPTVETDNNKATNPLPTASNELDTNKDDNGNPLPTTDTSSSQIPDSHTNNQANANPTHDSPKSSTTTIATSNQDSNFVNQTNPPTATDSVQQTNKDNNGNLIPTDESSTSQIPNLDANKQASAIATDDSPKSSTTMVPTYNQDPNLVNLTNPPTVGSGTKKDTNQSIQTAYTDSETDEKTASIDSAKEARKYLENLIGQELKLVEKFYPRLGEHEKTIKEDAKRASEQYEKLRKETCDLKELIDLNKKVIKLRLQIPARYMTYEQRDKQKNQQSDVENRDNIPSKLKEKMPQLHGKLFYESPICKTIHLRYSKLKSELKLCLLCFLVFPEKTIISRRSMVYWWIGEGFIPREEDAEECANEFFKELMDNEFIEPVSRSYKHRYVSSCKMNPMVRAALIMIADSIKFFDFDEYGNPRDFGKFDEIESPEDMPDVYPLGDPREFFDFFDAKRNLISEPIDFVDSIGNPCQFAALPQDASKAPVKRDGKPIDIDRKHYLYVKRKITTKSHKVCLVGSGLSKGIPWEKLRMLFNVQAKNLEFRKEWFLRLEDVKILFLGGWQSSVVHWIEIKGLEFEKCLDNMKHVRFFSLHGVSMISKLPDSISKLKSLLILDLRACHNLEVVPETIGSLKCLTHLDMSECYLLNKMPKEISFLESLQVLKGFVVVESTGIDICTLEDLTKLENLTKLHMYTHMKRFPEESHLDALEKFEMLRKLTIFWRGHESLSQTKESGNKKKSIASKVKNFISGKKWVEGSMRRMNAFGGSTLGLRLEKLDLRCFPRYQPQSWITAGNLKGLKKLYIRGGNFSDLGQFDGILDWNDSPNFLKETWNVEVLRLRYLEELNIEWREVHNLFPKLIYLEKVKCPKLTLFPCNEQGVWMKKGSTTN